MKRIASAIVVFGLAAFFVSMLSQSVSAAETPADRVVVMYFHRTQRCPTCLKMGGYSEEAVKTGFARELREGKVEFHSIDFQDGKNEALVKGYEIAGPALLVVRVTDNKAAKHENLTEIWTKVRDGKESFIAYVQENVKKHIK